MGARSAKPVEGKSTDLREKNDAGFALRAAAAGLLAGAAFYAIGEFWVDEVRQSRLGLTALACVATFAVVFLLLARSGSFWRGAPYALAIAVISAAPAYGVLWVLDFGEDLHLFPALFWALVGAPMSAYLMAVFARAVLEDGAPPPYSTVFFHGLTMPLIAVGAFLIALLALVLLFAWALLMRSIDIDAFHALFQEPWFILPFLGAVGGLAIALMRRQATVLGALRYILLLASRMLTPILAVLCVTLTIAFAVNGFDAAFMRPSPAAVSLLLAFVSALVINGVYQNGESPPPGLWLRMPALVVLATIPIFAAAAAYALHLRIDAYGLTPPRVLGLAMTALAGAYGAISLAALATEFRWGANTWLPVLAPLNQVMAGLWVIAFLALATPVADPWRLSAGNQAQRLLTGSVSTEDFDFGYLRFQLGEHGERALDRLRQAEDHPEARALREGVDRARNALSYWEHQRDAAARKAETAPQDGPMGLELNPSDNPDADKMRDGVDDPD